MKFNIVLALPGGDPTDLHSQCFLETAYVIRYGLEDLGYEVLFAKGFQKDCINILLGYQFLHGQPLPAGYKYIAYQLEELAEHDAWPVENLETFRSPDCVVWDFSENNIDFLAQRDIKAVLKPIGFHPKMFRVKQRQIKDVDVLFYGTRNERRIKILKELARICNVKVLFGVYGEERDNWIGRAKIVVSIYYYDTKLFDDVRISYLVNNKAFSIIEDSPNKKYDDFLIYTPYDEIVERCQYYLRNPEERQATVNSAFQSFSHYPESEFLRTALSQSY